MDVTIASEERASLQAEFSRWLGRHGALLQASEASGEARRAFSLTARSLLTRDEYVHKLSLSCPERPRSSPEPQVAPRTTLARLTGFSLLYSLVRMRDSFIRTPTRNMRYILIDEPAPLARAPTPEHSTPDRDYGFPVRSQHI